MKKIIAAACLSALVLAGCDKTKKSSTNNDTTTVPAVTAADTTETEAVTAGTEPVKTTVPVQTVPPTTHEADVPAGGIKDMSPAIYEQFLRRRFEETATEKNGIAYIEYGYRDVDADGIPELFLKRGTCEADFVLEEYTLMPEGEPVKIGEFGGGHTVVCYEEKSDRIAVVTNYMGMVNIVYTSVDDGKLIENEHVEERMPEQTEYADFLKEKQMINIPCATVYRSDSESEGYSVIPQENGGSERLEGLHFDYYIKLD